MKAAVYFLAVYAAVVSLTLLFVVLDRGHRLHVWLSTRGLNKRYEALLNEAERGNGRG